MPDGLLVDADPNDWGGGHSSVGSRGSARSTLNAIRAGRMKSEGNNPEALSRHGSGYPATPSRVYANPSFDGHDDVEAAGMRTPQKRSSRSPDNGEEHFGNRSTFNESGGKHKRVAELMGPGSGGGANVRLDRHHSHQERVLDRQDSAGSEAHAPSRSSSLLNASLNVFRKAQPAAAVPASGGPVQAQDSGTMVQAFNTAQDDEEQLERSRLSPCRTRGSGGNMPATPRTPKSHVTKASWDVEIKQLIAANSRAAIFDRPAPAGEGLVRCYILRSKGSWGGQLCYSMFLENCDMFLMSARKRKKTKSSYYVISQDEQDTSRHSDKCIAKLKANLMGSELTLWDRTEHPEVRKGFGAEALCTQFRAFSMEAGKDKEAEDKGKKAAAGPERSMWIMFGMPGSGWRPSFPEGGADSLSIYLDLARGQPDHMPAEMARHVRVLTVRAPELERKVPGTKGFTIDQEGRVKEPSKKNFQLVAWSPLSGEVADEVVLQFGKVDENKYALDFAFPLSMKQAFAIALTAMDRGAPR